MIRTILLPLFTLFFAGASVANAGVMCVMNDEGSIDEGAQSVCATSMAMAVIVDSDDKPYTISEVPDSMTDLSGPVTSVSVISGNAIAAVVDNVVPLPQIGYRLLLLNSSHPPTPDIDGLIKPPQKVS